VEETVYVVDEEDEDETVRVRHFPFHTSEERSGMKSGQLNY